MLGLARVSADGFDDQAVSWAQQGIGGGSEAGGGPRAARRASRWRTTSRSWPAKEADAALALDPQSLDAMAMHAVIEILADRSPDEWWARLHGINPVYGQGYAIAAEQLILNRRYQDGVALYRKALELSPKLWSARSRAGHQPDAPGAG